MRTFIKSILFLGIVAFMFTSCEEDEFTEKDAMDQLQHIDVSLNVTDGSSYGEAVEGATVELAGDSTTSSKTTDSAGNVTFNDVAVGTNLSVYVHKEDFTKAMYSISTLTESYRENVITENLKIYSLSGDNMATVKGKLTIETDLTNYEREVLSGQEVKVVNNSLGNEVASAFVGTTDEDGRYEIKVPVNPQGNDNLRVSFQDEVEADQTLALETEDGDYVVETVPATYYGDNYDPSSFMSIPSPVVTVDAPGSSGSGFKLGTEARGVYFSDYSDIDIIKGGAGYTEGDTILSMSEGINGRSAKVRVVVDANGSVSSLNYSGSYYDEDEMAYLPYHNDALYTSAPTLDLSGLGGSGAILDIQFEGSYAIFIEDYGTGYSAIPQIDVEYKEYVGNQVVKKNDRWEEALSSFFSSYVKNYQGSIYSAGNNGDTLLFFNGIVEAPAFKVSTTTSEQAVIEIESSMINENDGSVFNANVVNAGLGYDPENPPSVTVSSLAGYGSGADISVEVNTSGQISEVKIVDGGEGYVRNVNDYNGDGMLSPSESGYSHNSSLYIPDVSPGDVIVRNPYYGTGIRE